MCFFSKYQRLNFKIHQYTILAGNQSSLAQMFIQEPRVAKASWPSGHAVAIIDKAN